MTTNVLFACPHSAGKSLLAATYFRAAAERIGLDVKIEVAGTEPDDYNMPNVTEALERQGFAIGWTPKLITSPMASAADLIISIGCDLDPISTDTPIADWDTPLLSEDFDGSVRAIHGFAEELATQLDESP